MTDHKFADSNVIIYAVGKESAQRSKAQEIIANGVTVSTQVINETVSVLTRKQGLTLFAAHEIAESLLELTAIVPVEERTIREAIRLANRYQISHWDSLIIVAALLAECQILYSQDLQHGQVFDDQLKIVNPFC
jgi:predicted nucleic acid-binding protein